MPGARIWTELTPEATDGLLGASVSGIADVVEVRPERMPDLAVTSHTFWYDDCWVSDEVPVMPQFHLVPDARGLTPGTAPSEAGYRVLPSEYTDRVLAVAARLRAENG